MSMSKGKCLQRFHLRVCLVNFLFMFFILLLLFVDESENIFFLLDLIRTIEPIRVEDQLQAAISYFKNAGQCTHVIGCNLSYIVESIHNRKSFVYCLHQAIQGYDEKHEVAASEFHAIVDTLFPGFPWSLILEAVHAASGDNYSNSSQFHQNDATKKYSVIVLSKILSFYILYDEWIKATEELFKSEGRSMVVILHRVRNYMEDLQRNQGNRLYQPPFAAVASVLDTYEGSRNGGEISFHRFKNSVMSHDAVQAELNLLQNYPAMV